MAQQLDGFANYQEYGSDLLTTPAGFKDMPCQYVFEFDVTSPAGVIQVPMNTDYDVPFIVRAICAGFIAGGADLPFTFRMTDSEQRYLSNQEAPSYMEGNGNLANLRPIKPSLVIPPGGVIYFDLTWGVPGSATPFATANVAQIVLAGHKRYKLSEAPERIPRAWIDRYKEYRVTIQLGFNANVPDASLIVDDAGEFRLFGYQLETPGGLFAKLRLRTDGGYLIHESEISQGLMGPVQLPKTLYPVARIPAGGRIDIELDETTGVT